MSLFLSVVPVGEAIDILRGCTAPVGTETVPLDHAVSRVLGADAVADIDIPGFSRSVIDGYAVRAADTEGAGEAIPSMLDCTGIVEMGRPDTAELAPGTCRYIPTGGALPPGADAAVMIEYCERIGDQVLVGRAVAPGENVVMRGEDFTKGDVAVRKGTLLRAQECGVLAAVGHASVEVMKRPRIGIISTGSELVPVSRVPEGGQVRDVNSSLCSAFAVRQGCVPCTFGIVRDDRALLEETVRRALAECDAIFISGGSSKDMRDHTAAVIGDVGEMLVHGIAISPGKPTIIGKSENKPIMGLPGHPASAFVVLSVLGSAMIAAMLGTGYRHDTASARLTQNVPSQRGREDYVRVSLEGTHATPLFGKSGLLNTLTRSDGIVRIPAGSEGMERGAEVEVILW